MKIVGRDHYIDLSYLTAPAIKSFDQLQELLKPKAALRINLDETIEPGMASLGIALCDPPLKITNSARNWSLSENDQYYIVKHNDGQYVTEAWRLTDDASFHHLLARLAAGHVLTVKNDAGYKIIATSEDAPNLKTTRDVRSLWMNVCRGWFDQELLSLVNWSFTVRRANHLDRLIRDVALTWTGKVEDTATAVEGLVTGDQEGNEVFSASRYVSEVMPRVLSGHIGEFCTFIEDDPWAYYNVTIDRIGVLVTRHCDARALIWNNTALEDQLRAETEN